MDGKENSAMNYGPVGALAPLGEAFAAALDEEVARLQGVAMAYCVALHEGKQAYEERRREPQNDQMQDVDEDMQSECPSGRSSGSVGLVSSASQKDDSLKDKWAEVEALLGGLRPTKHLQKSPDQAVYPHGSRRRVLQVQSEIKTLRTRFSKGNSSMYNTDPVHTTYSALGLLRWVFNAWHARCVLGCEKRTKRARADSYRRRRLLDRAWIKWIEYSDRRQNLQQCSAKLVQTNHHRILKTRLRHWWQIRRWNRAAKLLGSVHTKCVLQSAIICWIELRAMCRHLKAMRSRTEQRYLDNAFGRWKSFTAARSARRSLQLMGYRSKLCRCFRRLVVGIDTSRRRREMILRATTFRRSTQLQFAFRSWGQFVEERRREHLAIEWWSHCVIISCFETWVLYRQLRRHRFRLRASAYRCYSHALMRKVLSSWQEHVEERRLVHDTLKNLVYRQLVRACFQAMKYEVASYRAKLERLNEWRIRRCISAWSTRSRCASRLCDAQLCVSATRRRRLLEHFAWPVWREALHSSRRLKRLEFDAQLQFTRKWWRLWSNYPSRKKAKQAMADVITADYERRAKQWAFKKWREYTTLHAQRRFAMLACEVFHNQQLIKHGLRRWKTRIQYSEWSAQAARLAAMFFLRNQWAKLQRSLRFKRQTNQVRLETVEKNRPSWRKRSYFAVWKMAARARVRCRLERLFGKWQHYLHIKARDQALVALQSSIMTRHWCRRWRAYVKSQFHLRERFHRLEYLSNLRLLKRVFSSRWMIKTKRYLRARDLLERVAVRHCLQTRFMEWYQHTQMQKIHRRVFQLHRRQSMVKTFRALHSYTIHRPRELMHKRKERILRRIFLGWCDRYKRRQSHIQAALQLQQHHARRAVHRWTSFVYERRIADASMAIANHRYEQTALSRAMKAWTKYRESIVNSRFAVQEIRARGVETNFRRWRNAYAQQIVVRDLELRHQLTVLRRSWEHFILVVKAHKDARLAWLNRLLLLPLGKVIFRWRQLVHIQRQTIEVSNSLRARWTHRTCKTALETWVQFVTVRAFVCLRVRRAAFQMKSYSMRFWKLFTVMKRKRRVLREQFQRAMLLGLKKNVSVYRACREVGLRRQSRIFQTYWRQWRIEFWNKRCSALRLLSAAQRCFDAWRDYAYQMASRRDRFSAALEHELVPCHSAPFVDALWLQETARRNRQTVKRALHGWRLLIICRKRRDPLRDVCAD